MPKLDTSRMQSISSPQAQTSSIALDGQSDAFVILDSAPAEVVFWTGAGISISPPTRLPPGDLLTEQVVRAYCREGTWEKLTGYLAQSQAEDSVGRRKRIPRLEAVFESIIRSLGDGVLRILSPCSRAQPNDAHYFFAQHLRHGGGHLTMNFDTCVERAGTKQRPQGAVEAAGPVDGSDWMARGEILHLHGVYDERCLSELGARVNNVASGLPEMVCQTVLRILQGRRHVVFTGYSGRDCFDVNPFFQGLPGNVAFPSGFMAIWLQHDPECSTPTVCRLDPLCDGYEILVSLERCGARVLYVRADTSGYLHQLAQRWGFTQHGSALGSSDSPQDQAETEAITSEQRTVATAGLFVSMGVGPEVIALSSTLAGIGTQGTGATALQVAASDALLSGLRDVGLYRAAMRVARRLPSADTYQRMRRHHELAKLHWLRGDFAHAWYHFAKVASLYRARRAPWGDDVERLYTESLTTKLHWFRDTRRLLRWSHVVLPLSVAVDAFQRLCAAETIAGKDPHAGAKILRLHEEVPGLRGRVSLPEWISTAVPHLTFAFAETDSLLGIVNFSRYDIISRARGGELPREDELQMLLLRSRIIDSKGGILKAALLLKQYCGREDPLAMSCLREIEWAPWLKAVWLAQWHIARWRRRSESS